ncbi:hypothetical protein ACWDLG_39355 [Nonomuraea sp. NPDC003727]
MGGARPVHLHHRRLPPLIVKHSGQVVDIAGARGVIRWVAGAGDHEKFELQPISDANW